MSQIDTNLREITTWLSPAPDVSALRTDDAFMDTLTKAMNYTLYLARLAPAMMRSDKESSHGVLRHRAIPLGLMVRMAKLYEGFLEAVCRRRMELAGLFWRPIYETEVRLHYILTAGRAVRRNYVETAYRDLRQRFDDLVKKGRSRPLSPIETRMLKNMRASLRRDRVALRALRSRKSWELDGKNVRDLLKGLDREAEYPYLYGTSSRFQHGSWLEVSFYHLSCKGRRYQPRLSFSDVDARIAAPLTKLCLQAIERYLKWARPREWQNVLGVAALLHDFVEHLDSAHEEWLAQGARA